MSNLISYLENRKGLRYLIMVALIAVTVSCLNIHKYYVLTIRGKPSEATIVKADAAPSVDHAPCSATYQYKVDGAGYVNTRIYGNGACLIPIGSHHSVYYDPENPEVILINWEPQAALANEIISIALMSLLVPAIFLWIETATKTKRAKAVPPSVEP